VKIIGLNGRTYTWNLSAYERDGRACSSYHARARSVLREIYPLDRILEEVPLPGTDGLKADFVLPMRSLVVEVQGEQHYRQVGHFHRHITDFWAGRKRDADKRRWCEQNKLTLVEFPYGERADEWEHKVREAVRFGNSEPAG